MTAWFAPAKLNLTLRVGPPQADGRHPLDSLVCFTKRLGDYLSVATAAELELEISGPFGEGLSAGKDNLVCRAAQILADVARIPANANIRLIKNLPIALYRDIKAQLMHPRFELSTCPAALACW